jgi:hypothetical protein
MIEQETVDRSGPAAGEEILEPGLVEPRGAGLATVDTGEEDHLAVLGEQVHHLVIHADVDIIAIGVMELADRRFVLEPADPRGERLHLGFQRAFVRHVRPTALCMGPILCCAA